MLENLFNEIKVANPVMVSIVHVFNRLPAIHKSKSLHKLYGSFVLLITLPHYIMHTKVMELLIQDTKYPSVCQLTHLMRMALFSIKIAGTERGKALRAPQELEITLTP